uniref:Uncharacterized protein n=1 Tax=Populus trichocarpa TaxID=3694 RepID=A0A3N7FC86_POPTR
MLLFLDIYGPHSGSSRRVVLYTKSVQGTLVVNINLMLIALLPSRKYQPHRDQLDGLGTKTLLMKKTRQALLCRLLLALQAAAHRRLARLQP